jgi:hypothetical protein
MKIIRTVTLRVEFTGEEIDDILKAHVAKTVPEVKKMAVASSQLGNIDVGESLCGSMIEFEGA